MVHRHFRQNVGGGHRVENIGFAALTNLPAVRCLAGQIGIVDRLDLFRIEVAFQNLFQLPNGFGKSLTVRWDCGDRVFHLA